MFKEAGCIKLLLLLLLLFSARKSCLAHTHRGQSARNKLIDKIKRKNNITKLMHMTHVQILVP